MYAAELIQHAVLLLTSIAVQGALEWLEINQDKSFDEILATSAAEAERDPNTEPAALNPGEEAHSLVCNECGKKFRSQAQAEFHASKTQHVDFAESTDEIAPLNEAEKKARLEELRHKLAEKRAGMSEQDKVDKKRNEVCPMLMVPLCYVDSNRFSGNSQKEHQRDSGCEGRSEKEGAAQGGRREKKRKAGRNRRQGSDQSEDSIG